MKTLPAGRVAPDAQTDAEREIVQLIDVQFWLMGRDVEHPQGNLLTRIGFTREEPQPPATVSCYWRMRSGLHCRTEGHCRSRPPCGPWPCEAVIWPYGMLLRTAVGDAVLRRGGRPVVATSAGFAVMRRGADRAPNGDPCPDPLLREVCCWFAQYERTVAALGGVAHRVPRPRTNPSLAPPAPCSHAETWSSLASQLG